MRYPRDPQELTEPIERLRKACDEVGRDPETLDVTASVSAAFPNLGQTKPFAEKRLTGSVDVLAQAFQQYTEADTTHLIIQPTPVNHKRHGKRKVLPLPGTRFLRRACYRQVKDANRKIYGHRNYLHFEVINFRNLSCGLNDSANENIG
ncbi:hypothetical protein ACFLXI_08815, partial [Chloroflexota bacterium]